MRKKTLLFIATIITMLTVIACTTVDVIAKDNNIEKQTVTVTMMKGCYDDEQFKGEVRIEQMFVEETKENREGYFVTLMDTDNNVWKVKDVDLYLYEEVLVLIADNETPEDVTDDMIIHCWVGLE